LIYPELAAQWHPARNGALTPHDVSVGCNKKVWWKCLIVDDHEWEASPNTRTNGGNGCPCCAGKKVVLSNCLMTTHPDLAAQWHQTKNGSLIPRDVVAGSAKNVWWQCSVASDHEWTASLVNRTRVGSDCPCCDGKLAVLSNCLMTTHPELASQWHPTKNGHLTPCDVVAGSNKKRWWRCSVVTDHEWEAVVASRAMDGKGCPYCNESQGEKAIALILSRRGYRFEREVRFDDCKYKYTLPFDFLVWLPDGKRFLIEFQGRHHYESSSWDSSITKEEADAKLEEVQKRDQIKKRYADDNGVHLLVIPYWDRQIMESLVDGFIRGFV
jgi:hypothetical protein